MRRCLGRALATPLLDRDMVNQWMLPQSVADDYASSGDSTFVAVALGLFLVTVAAMWRVFRLAGEPGWAAIVPLYDGIVLLRIAGMSAWWVLLLLVPLVNVFVLLAVATGVARRFGHGGAFAAGLWIAPFVFYPILALADERPHPRAA
jgi:hypothetical protein